MRVCSRSSIGGQVSLANSVFVGRNVHISGEVNIGPNVHIEDDVEIRGPADIAADVWIGRETSIGSHRAPEAPGPAEPVRTRIGERALIGKGCVLEGHLPGRVLFCPPAGPPVWRPASPWHGLWRPGCAA